MFTTMLLLSGNFIQLEQANPTFGVCIFLTAILDIIAAICFFKLCYDISKIAATKKKKQENPGEINNEEKMVELLQGVLLAQQKTKDALSDLSNQLALANKNSQNLQVQKAKQETANEEKRLKLIEEQNKLLFEYIKAKAEVIKPEPEPDDFEKLLLKK